MRPLRELSRETCRDLHGLLFDLDDTFLEHGVLTEAAYSALWRLKATGLTLIAVTGRPASWGSLFAQIWPVEAVISENGHIAYRRVAGRVKAIDSVPEAQRAKRTKKLVEIAERLMSEVPELRFSDDTKGRISDLTFDIGEHQVLDRGVVISARKRAEQLGARTALSSVHLHITLDTHDKASGVLALLRTELGWDSTRARARFAYIGDSENDASCFAAFRTSVSVSNLRGQFSLPPAYICAGESAAGFVELAERIISSKK